MLFYTTNAFGLSHFCQNEDALERRLIAVHELMSRYYGPPDVLQELIEGARARLATIR
jgi:hypothetical protein